MQTGDKVTIYTKRGTHVGGGVVVDPRRFTVGIKAGVKVIYYSRDLYDFKVENETVTTN